MRTLSLSGRLHGAEAAGREDARNRPCSLHVKLALFDLKLGSFQMQFSPVTPKDIAFLRALEGRYSISLGNKRLAFLMGLFFCLAIPCLMGYAFFQYGVLEWPFTEDEWAVVTIGIGSPALGLGLWLSSFREWEFTPEQITAHRRGKILWQISIADITGTNFQRTGANTGWLHLSVGSRRVSVLLVPDLLVRMKSIRPTIEHGA